MALKNVSDVGMEFSDTWHCHRWKSQAQYLAHQLHQQEQQQPEQWQQQSLNHESRGERNCCVPVIRKMHTTRNRNANITTQMWSLSYYPAARLSSPLNLQEVNKNSQSRKPEQHHAQEHKKLQYIVPYNLRRIANLVSFIITFLGRITPIQCYWNPTLPAVHSRRIQNQRMPPKQKSIFEVDTVCSLLTISELSRAPSNFVRKTSSATQMLGRSSGGSQSRSGGKLILSFEEFDRLVLHPVPTTGNKIAPPILVFYIAPWCGPCRLTIPVVKEVMKQYCASTEELLQQQQQQQHQSFDSLTSNENSGSKLFSMEFYEVCTDDLPDVTAAAGIVSIPTIQIYVSGTLHDTIVGSISKNVLCSTIEKIQEDMMMKMSSRTATTTTTTTSKYNRKDKP
jgi:thioredoxin 1